MVPAHAALQTISAVVAKVRPGLAFRFNPATDLQTEDDEFELLQDGQPLRWRDGREFVGYGIQICQDRTYSANRYNYTRGGKLKTRTGMQSFLGSARLAAVAIAEDLRRLVVALAAADIPRREAKHEKAAIAYAMAVAGHAPELPRRKRELRRAAIALVEAIREANQ